MCLFFYPLEFYDEIQRSKGDQSIGEDPSEKLNLTNSTGFLKIKCNGEKTASSTSGAGKTVQLHVKE